MIGQYVRFNLKSIFFTGAVIIHILCQFLCLTVHTPYQGTAIHSILYNIYNDSSLAFFLPAVSAIPAACNFVRQWRSNSFPYVFKRAGKINYTISVQISSALTAFVVSIAGNLIFIIILSVKFPMIADSYSMADQAVRVSANGALLMKGRFFLYYTLMIATQGALYALFTSIAVCISTVITDVYITVVSPVAAYGIITNLFRFMGLPRILNPFYVYSAFCYNIINLTKDYDINADMNYSVMSGIYPYLYTLVGIVLFTLLTCLSLMNKYERGKSI